jgi:hypothetical protein
VLHNFHRFAPQKSDEAGGTPAYHCLGISPGSRGKPAPPVLRPPSL